MNEQREAVVLSKTSLGFGLKVGDVVTYTVRAATAEAAEKEALVIANRDVIRGYTRNPRFRVVGTVGLDKPDTWHIRVEMYAV